MLVCSLNDVLLTPRMAFFLENEYFRGIILICKGKSKVFYGQEPLSGESTTTECGVNYQLLAVIY